MIDFDIEKLSAEMKSWFANAIVGMITADGAVTDDEVSFLREAIDFLDNIEDINRIVELVKQRESPPLQSSKVDILVARAMLFYIADIAVIDGSLSQQEVNYFKYMGNKIGIDETYTIKVIGWAKDNYKLKKRKQELLREI
ncbi:MAG: hypothetical protein HN580_07600 [Deltaproteobacteria bacterium]|jgi:uncharacterized tellurite resistance protein B-like protein|nr:hypothetical protein [Deltaproteobacteria bacterium]MBT4640422.1 hypothetical protein [Deltaproteobacteria bacterium]MBT7154383.1 hypothetical protein [Deltaproteobacteria bacterium]MBT7888869.1 hypothetical protein [Deltaproteobacteria bacterium]